MSVQIIKHYISNEDADMIVSGLKNKLIPEPRPGMSSALGQKNSFEASKVSINNPASELGEDELENSAILFVSDIVNKIKNTMEEFYSIDLDLVNMNFSQISEGGYNPMHSDSTKLDGSPWRDDGIPEEIEYSALLYASQSGVDFSGGQIYFPQHNLSVSPDKGSLIFFKGDVDHIHEVQPVESGKRHTLVLFYGKRGNVSETEFFTD